MDSLPSVAPALPAADAAAVSLCQRVVLSMPWAVLVLGREGRLRLVNPLAAALLGCPAEALQSQLLEQALPADLPADLRHALQTALHAAEPVTVDFYLPKAERWIEMTTLPGDDETVVYWQDITRAVQQHQPDRALADHTPDAVVRWGPDLCLQCANVAMEREAGRPLAELQGLTLADVGVPASQSEPYNETS